MQQIPDISQIFTIADDADFESMALHVFAFQYEHNQVYKSFCDAIHRRPTSVKTWQQIPFMPISFFQQHKVASFEGKEETVFNSSGTTGSVPSVHYVHDLEVYKKSFTLGFERFYGNPRQYALLALLPGYLERSNSSLVYMVDSLMKMGADPLSGFYLHNLQKLAETLEYLHKINKKIMLVGVSYALLDLAEQYPVKIPNAIIMETGGMKGKRKELIRDELHGILKSAFGVASIHSEYGMTELLSQAYSKGDGIFACPPWMRVAISDINDPLGYADFGKTGGINIVDLANFYSCSFIATQDLGRLHPNNCFEVLGRFDHSAARGCNLMVE